MTDAGAWTCSRCGMAGAARLESRPSIDDRYAVGYCAGRCTPPLKDDPKDASRRKPRERGTVPLVCSDVFDPATLDAHRQREADRRLMRGETGGRGADARRAKLRARWDRETAERRAAP